MSKAPVYLILREREFHATFLSILNKNEFRVTEMRETTVIKSRTDRVFPSSPRTMSVHNGLRKNSNSCSLYYYIHYGYIGHRDYIDKVRNQSERVHKDFK
jgi:hypothetical protein